MISLLTNSEKVGNLKLFLLMGDDILRRLKLKSMFYFYLNDSK